MTRRHTVGEQFEVDGFACRIVAGTKAPDDQRLDVKGPAEFAPVTFGIAFAVMDILGQNEDTLYPHGRGGAMVRSALLTAYRDGWPTAWSQLQVDRARADDRRRSWADW